MPPKRSSPSKVFGSKPKRQRKMLTLKEKVELLDMLKEGRSYAAVGRHYGINESTVRYIKKDEKNIRSAAGVTFNKTAKRVVTSRNETIVKMESALVTWINDCREKNISLDTNTIRTKAKQLYDQLAAKRDSHDGDGNEDKDQIAEAGPSSASSPRPTPFSASKGWFDKFQKRFGLKSISLHGEAASADKAGAEENASNMFKDAEEENGEQDGQRIEEEEGVGLTLDRLATAVRMAEELQRVIEEWDPNVVRSLQFTNAVENAMSAYKTILSQKKKQCQRLPMTTFITQTKQSVTPTPLAEVAVKSEARDTALPEEAPDESAALEGPSRSP